MKKGPDGPKYCSFEKVEENKQFFSGFGGSAFFTCSFYDRVWPKIRKFQNFENVGLSLQQAVQMPLTKHPKKYVPPDFFLKEDSNFTLFKKKLSQIFFI